MARVKRFRTLGEIRSKEPASSPAESKKAEIHHRVKPRKTRSDIRHRFTLRIEQQPWARLREISLSCGGSSKGASYNVICNKLIEYALADDEIVKKIVNSYPQGDIILVRSWGWDK